VISYKFSSACLVAMSDVSRFKVEALSFTTLHLHKSTTLHLYESTTLRLIAICYQPSAISYKIASSSLLAMTGDSTLFLFDPVGVVLLMHGFLSGYDPYGVNRRIGLRLCISTNQRLYG